MSFFTRTRRKFRYEGDLREVKMEMCASDAYDLAIVLCLVGAPNGPRLMAFLEDSERSDADVMHLRESDSIKADPELRTRVAEEAANYKESRDLPPRRLNMPRTSMNRRILTNFLLDSRSPILHTEPMQSTRVVMSRSERSSSI